MKFVKLYKYENDEEVIITPIQQNEDDVPFRCRIIADKGMLIKKEGIEGTTVIDTDDIEGWEEIIDPDYIPCEENEVNS